MTLVADGVKVDAPIVFKIVDVHSDRFRDWSTAFQATSRIAEKPPSATVRVWPERCLQLLFSIWSQNPRVTIADNGFIVRIKTAPDEGSISGLVIQEALIGEASMIPVRLIENVVVMTLRTTYDNWLCDFTFHSFSGRTNSVLSLCAGRIIGSDLESKADRPA